MPITMDHLMRIVAECEEMRAAFLALRRAIFQASEPSELPLAHDNLLALRAMAEDAFRAPNDRETHAARRHFEANRGRLRRERLRAALRRAQSAEERAEAHKLANAKTQALQDLEGHAWTQEEIQRAIARVERERAEGYQGLPETTPKGKH